MQHIAGKFSSVIIFIAIIFTVQIAQAQQILFRNYSVDNGLCSNTVSAISQDSQGYMWFGTKNGLNRFDGYEFKSYRFNKKVATSIGNNGILTIFNYNKDSCWIGTEKGIYILNLEQETFHYLKKVGKKKIFDIIKDLKGNLWIATDNGVYHYNPKDGAVKKFIHSQKTQNSLSSNSVRCLLLDNDGNIWLGTSWKGIDVLNPRTLTFRHYQADGKPGSLSSNFITVLYKGLDGNIWIGTEKGGMDRWNKSSHTFKHFEHAGNNSISDNIVRAIYQPAPGKLYIGTEKGLDIYDLKTKIFTNYTYKPNKRNSISDNAIYNIFKDKEGGIWIGTYFGGVDYFHGEHPNFELYYPTGSANSLSGKAVSAMLQADSDHIWIGTEDGGLNYFNTRNKTIKHFPFKPKQDSLSYHNIHTLIKDTAGKIWIGTFTGGVNVYSPKTGKVKICKFSQGDQISSYNNMIYSIYQDREDKIWIGTVGGLYFYDPEKDRLVKMQGMILDRSWIYDIYEDKNDIIWFGTYNNGLIGENKQNGKWYHFTKNDKSNSLSSEKVICLMEDHLGNLWIGTDGGGLNRFNIKDKKIKVFGKKNGINANTIYGILEDDKGHLWLSTNNGLFDFDPKSKTSRHYTKWDHLQGTQFNYKSYLKTSDGKFYFGGIRGFNTFYPDSIKNIQTETSIRFTDFQLFNKEVPIQAKNSPLKTSITYTNHLTLSHKQSMFSIGYAALNYIAPQKIQYAYKMEGYDNNWNYVGNQRKATYTNLPPGNYTFKVKATDNNGNWSKKQATISIQILPPFYRTNLAYLIYALLLLTIILLLRKFEMRRIKQKNKIKLERLKNKREQEFYKQKIDFFTAMAHEIRTPLSLIIAPLEKLLSADKWKPATRKQLELMDENSNRLLTLTNQLLDFRKMECDLYEIHLEKVELVSFVQSLFARFSSISYQKGIKFSLSIKINNLEVQADPEALTKILSNLLINAFKFTRSRVEISINEIFNKQEQQFFSISVEDDGIGIPQKDIDHIFEKFYQVSAGEHQYNNLGGNGIGLALAKTLAQKHSGDLLIESEEGVKTIFTVLIPFVSRETTIIKSDNNVSEKEEENKEPSQTILIIEDDISLLDFIHKCIKEAGFKSLSAKNGKEALVLLEHNNVDLIISDIMMPEMDGLEFCKSVKGNMNFSHIPLILLTARANMETEIEGIENGADAYITKPFKWKHVLAVVKNLLESRLKLKQKFSQQPFADAGSLVTNSGDRKFLDKIITIIKERMDDQQLSVEVLSHEMTMSRSTLHKKLKAISGHVPNEFIRLIRLKHAVKLLLQKEYSISEIGYMTGFNSPSYFSKCFYQQFKLTPSEFVEKEAQKDIIT